MSSTMVKEKQTLSLGITRCPGETKKAPHGINPKSMTFNIKVKNTHISIINALVSKLCHNAMIELNPTHFV